ncbi:hypothetical protein DICA1_F21132 [Diutina catenulata]
MFSFNDYDRLIEHLTHLKTQAQVIRRVETPDFYSVELEREGSFAGFDLMAKRVGQGVSLAVSGGDLSPYYQEFNFPQGDPTKVNWENSGSQLKLTVLKRKHPQYLLNLLTQDGQRTSAQAHKMNYLSTGGDPVLWAEAEKMVKAYQTAHDIRDENENYENRKFMNPLNDMAKVMQLAQSIQAEDERWENEQMLKETNNMAKAVGITTQMDNQNDLRETEKMAKAQGLSEQIENQNNLEQTEKLATAYKVAGEIKNENETYENRKFMKPLDDMLQANELHNKIEHEDQRYMKKKKGTSRPRHHVGLEDVLDEEFLYRQSL